MCNFCGIITFSNDNPNFAVGFYFLFFGGILFIFFLFCFVPPLNKCSSRRFTKKPVYNCNPITHNVSVTVTQHEVSPQ